MVGGGEDVDHGAHDVGVVAVVCLVAQQLLDAREDIGRLGERLHLEPLVDDQLLVGLLVEVRVRVGVRLRVRVRVRLRVRLRLLTLALA